MAQVKLGPLLTDIRGSVGGVTFQRNRFGISMRQKPIPLYSQTPAQFLVRSRMLSLQSSWQSLTSPQRLQWDRFMDYSGQGINKDKSVLLSGHALYLKYQMLRLLYDQPLLTTLAYSPMPHTEHFHWILHSSTNYWIILNNDVDITKYFFLFKMSNPRRENQAYSTKGLRFMKVEWHVSTDFKINDPYIEAFGVLPPASSWFHYTLQYFSTVSPVYSGIQTGISQIHSI